MKTLGMKPSAPRRQWPLIGAVVGVIALTGTITAPAFAADPDASSTSAAASTTSAADQSDTASSSTSREPSAAPEAPAANEPEAAGDDNILVFRSLESKLKDNVYTLTYGSETNPPTITFNHVELTSKTLTLNLKDWAAPGHSQDINMGIRFQREADTGLVRYFENTQNPGTNPITGDTNPTIWANISSDKKTDTKEVSLPSELTGSGASGVQISPVRYEADGNNVGHGVLTLSVKQYSTSTAPKPVLPKDIDSDDNNNLAINSGENYIRVKVPGAEAGRRYYMSAYLADTSRRKPWGDLWFTADKEGYVLLPSDVDAPAEKIKLVAQSRLDDNGKPVFFSETDSAPVVGWTYFTFPAQKKSATSTTSSTTTSNAKVSAADELSNKLKELEKEKAKNTTSSAAASSKTTRTLTSSLPPLPASDGVNKVTIIRQTVNGGGSTSSAPRVMSSPNNKVKPSKPQPKKTPKSPVQDAKKLTAIKSGKVRASYKDNVVTVTVPEREPGDWVYVYAYTPKPEGLGWVSLNEKKEFTIDTSGLPGGYHKLAILGDNEDLLGWVGVTVKESAEISGGGDSGPGTLLISQNNPTMSGSDWAWIFGSLAVLQAIIMAVAWLRTRRQGTES